MCALTGVQNQKIFYKYRTLWKKIIRSILPSSSLYLNILLKQSWMKCIDEYITAYFIPGNSQVPWLVQAVFYCQQENGSA